MTSQKPPPTRPSWSTTSTRTLQPEPSRLPNPEGLHLGSIGPVLLSHFVFFVYTLPGMGNVSHYHFLIDHRADSIQGAKARQKRDRNADKNAPKGDKSQAKSNEAAKKIVCAICKQPFVSSFLFLSAHLHAKSWCYRSW